MEIKFLNSEHKEFYETNIKRVKYEDTYHRAIIYLLGISSDLRNNLERLFNFKEDCVNLDGFKKTLGWVCGSDCRILRLAYNLWANRILQPSKALYYTPSEIFSGCDTEIVECMLEAIRIKYVY